MFLYMSIFPELCCNSQPFANWQFTSNHSTAARYAAARESSNKVVDIVSIYNSTFFDHRTNTFPKFPERYRLKNSEEAQQKSSNAEVQNPNSTTKNKKGSVWLHASPKSSPDSLWKIKDVNKTQSRQDEQETKKGEEVIYF